MIETCYELQVTPEQFAEMRTAEAVAVRNYSSDSGSHWAKVIGIGTVEEMQAMADETHLFIVPVGMTIDGQQMVLTSDLLEGAATP